MGTFGYMTLEYVTSGERTEKSDVFSFRVVLLELMTSQNHVDASRPLGDESLVEWQQEGGFGEVGPTTVRVVQCQPQNLHGQLNIFLPWRSGRFAAHGRLTEPEPCFSYL